MNEQKEPILEDKMLKKICSSLCKRCYGKGYSSVIIEEKGTGDHFLGQGDVKIDRQKSIVSPCNCERGRQFEDAVEKYTNRL